jgi:hypothetical protein
MYLLNFHASLNPHTSTPKSILDSTTISEILSQIYSYIFVIAVSDTGALTGDRHVAEGNAYQFLVAHPESKTPLVRPSYRWRGNFKTDQ